ncbi:hypothetical protein L227DRAFT_316274 [Lentinus tigrinus ALCF2SS1-6]|uniref:Uncharacterized protein n=1 Tax=Lentinus tigrinus ALCF2SS1-6 TaxID=1328759 RepID=A0A5C2SL92_9APHY|nr:hypothetical protein L227DRAFT_316274 [Lentinus tigrinus ALCF2SS1-6]
MAEERERISSRRHEYGDQGSPSRTGTESSERSAAAYSYRNWPAWPTAGFGATTLPSFRLHHPPVHRILPHGLQRCVAIVDRFTSARSGSCCSPFPSNTSSSADCGERAGELAATQCRLIACGTAVQNDWNPVDCAAFQNPSREYPAYRDSAAQRTTELGFQFAHCRLPTRAVRPFRLPTIVQSSLTPSAHIPALTTLTLRRWQNASIHANAAKASTPIVSPQHRSPSILLSMHGLRRAVLASFVGAIAQQDTHSQTNASTS